MSQNNQHRAGAHKPTSAAKKPNAQQRSKSAPTPPKKNRTGIIVFAAAAVIVAIVIAAMSLGGGGSANPAGSTSAQGSPQPTPDEAKYMGRLLPAGYQVPSVGSPGTYSSTVEMTELSATLGDTQITVPVADVTSAKITLFKYETPTATLPLIAYVKPSGALFVGVSFCPPCQGEWQTIQADGTLTCNACGTKRDLETGVGISGACKLYPLDELPVTLVDGSISIDRAVLDTWTPQPLDRQVG